MRRTSLRLTQLITAFALLAAACTSGESTQTAAPDGGWPLDGAVTLVDGSQLELGDLEGQDVVLWFWAPW